MEENLSGNLWPDRHAEKCATLSAIGVNAAELRAAEVWRRYIHTPLTPGHKFRSGHRAYLQA